VNDIDNKEKFKLIGYCMKGEDGKKLSPSFLVFDRFKQLEQLLSDILRSEENYFTNLAVEAQEKIYAAQVSVNVEQVRTVLETLTQSFEKGDKSGLTTIGAIFNARGEALPS